MGPSREACDRCHAMKTRCVRASSVHACVRCTRLGFDCHYSPPGKTGRPPGSKRKSSVPTDKRSEKSSATTPRSSPHARPVPCRKPRRQQSLHQQDEISSLVSSASSVSSLGGPAPPVGHEFADLDFFNTPPSVPEEESMNLFFMDDYIPDLHDHQNSHAQSASSPPETYSLMSNNSQYRYPEPKSAYSATSTPYTGEEDLLHTLLDMQTRLARVNKQLTQPGNSSADIDDIHRTAEAFISILDGYDEHSGQHIAPLLSSGNGVVVLLLSSCYVSLIQAYEALATLLRADLHKPSSASVTGMQPQHFLFPSMMPNVAVGSVGLSMPRKAITEVDLHVIGQTVQRLKTAMNNCSTRMAMPRFMQSHPALANTSGLGSIWHSSQVQSGFAPVTDLASAAMSEAKMREEGLLQHFQTSTF